MPGSDDFNERTKLRTPAGNTPPRAVAIAPPVISAPPTAQRTPVSTPPLEARSTRVGHLPVVVEVSLEELYSAGGSTNSLMDAALPLLLLALRLRTASESADPNHLQARIAEQIRAFEARARDAGVPGDDVGAARYALCTLLDECVLNTPWGAHSGWATQPLLILFHSEAFGGNKFFDIVSRVRREPARYLQLMELLYACLTVGLEGRYRHDAQGPALLTKIQRDLYESIREQRGMMPPELSITWAAALDQRPRLIRYVPLWLIAVIGLSVLLLVYLGFFAALGGVSGPVDAALDKIGLEPMYTAPAVAQAGPTMKQLLAPEEARRTVDVDDLGNKTVIRILVPELFTSGSDKINPAAGAVLQAIAAAVNQVPGRVVVVGHTDDQPVSSLRFGDNEQLSRARAQSAADLLRRYLQHGEGIEVVGRGSSQPIATPVDTQQNRARNRRIEIIHQAGV